MTIHYHGTPITPNSVLNTLAGRHFCVSFANPQNIRRVHEIGQSIMLDNGAFSFWRSKKPTDWNRYYAWSEEWLQYRQNWAVIPDVIDAGVEANDALIAQWPHGDSGAPVWHTDEPVSRLLKLAEKWSKICIGSSGSHKPRTAAWHRVMEDAMNQLCGNGPSPVWLHMLRGMALGGSPYPFASVDSTDIARNHHLPGKNAKTMADRWDAMQCPALWNVVNKEKSHER